jgi:hypothetical protein
MEFVKKLEFESRPKSERLTVPVPFSFEKRTPRKSTQTQQFSLESTRLAKDSEKGLVRVSKKNSTVPVEFKFATSSRISRSESNAQCKSKAHVASRPLVS